MTDTKRDDFMNTVHILFSKLDKALADNAALTAQLDGVWADNAALTAHIATADRTVWKLRDDNAALDAQLNKNLAERETARNDLKLARDGLSETLDVLAAERAERMAAQDVCARLMRGVNENENVALRQAQSALESMQSRFKGLEANMRGTMTALEDERNTVAHLRAQVQTKDDAITLLEEDNAALDARVGELLKAPIMPDHYPVGSKVYCRTTSGVRKSRIDGVRITVGESESQLHYTIDGGMWVPAQVFLTADEAFASTTH